MHALDVVLLCKSKKEGGSVRALPVAAPMPKSVPGLMRERIDCLERECVCMSLRTFHRWGDLLFIVDVQPVG